MIFKIGNNAPEIHPTAFVHPTAEVSGKVKIGARASVWGQCVLRGDVDWIEVAEDCNIQDGSIFHTSHGVPVKLAQGVTIGHKAIVHGAIIGAYSLIGMGAVLLDHSVVEENCLVAAGAVVRENGRVQKGQLAVGVPAKVVRPLTDAELKMVKERPGEYVLLADQYKRALKDAHLL